MFKRLSASIPVCLCLVLLAGGCGKAALIADDAIVLDHRATPLNAYVGRETLLDLCNDIRDVPVTFDVDGRQIGQDKADEAGRAFIVLHDASPDPASFHARTTVRGQKLEGDGHIFHWRQDRVTLAIDLDYCIVRTNYLRLLFGKHIPVSPPFPAAREVLFELSKDYQILYLTARPRSMLKRTRDWLHYYDFPPGPIVVADRFWAVLHQLEWKSNTLRQLQVDYPSLLVSIGNRNVDVESAARNDILPVIVKSSEIDVREAPGNIIIEDWEVMSEFFRVNRDTLIDPARLGAAIHDGLTILQPVPDSRGVYQYQEKHFGPAARSPGDSTAAAMGR